MRTNTRLRESPVQGQVTQVRTVPARPSGVPKQSTQRKAMHRNAPQCTAQSPILPSPCKTIPRRAKLSHTVMHAAYVCHDDDLYLEASFASLQGKIPATLFLSKSPWNGPKGNWKAVQKHAKSMGMSVVLGDWKDESEHRSAVLLWARQAGIRRLLIPDTDEVLSPELLATLTELAATEIADQVHVEMDTYWKSPEYVIRPRERLRPVILIDPTTVEHHHIRDYRGQRPLVLPSEHGVLHHLSYSGPDDRIRRKLATWSHRDEVVSDWLNNVWAKWDAERTMVNLHPTHPEAYGWAERIPVPAVLEPAMLAYQHANGGPDPLRAPSLLPINWPRLSVVIPLYGGPDDLEACLRSLYESIDLLADVIVVDDRSPDNAPDVVAAFPFARLVSNPTNMGFAATCNHGVSESIGDVLLLLNSDTIVPRDGLIRLIESLMSSGSIAAAGPLSNNVGHFQRTPATYTDASHISLFAEDFAQREAEDVDTDMLVGFCLAVKRSAWNEVGPLDESFGTGLFEDNDLCHRLRRAGYRLVISSRAFIHHEGNRSLDRTTEDKFAMFDRNRDLFAAKWRRDLETGFASHLCGTGPARVQFREERRPEKLDREVAKLAKQANISLCMIAKNEERVLGACLASAKPFFTQIIVVDTGSTDRTIEIAKKHGAEVHKFKWVDNFAAARDESMKYAKGSWIFWMDCDDTLPFSSGETLLRAATNAPKSIIGFSSKVRFVTDDPTHGTVVDHIKLFRNLPGLAWEFRIHEQILSSLRKQRGDVVPLDAEVLHSGYDTSEEGQKRKDQRDDHLLALALKELPDHPYMLFCRGMTDHYRKDHEPAIRYLRKCIEVCHDGETVLKKAYCLLGRSLRESGEVREALETFEQGIAACPADPELHFDRGQTLAHLGEHLAALESFRTVLRPQDQGTLSSLDLGILGYKTHVNMAVSLLVLGRYLEARDSMWKAIEERPGDLNLVFDLFKMARDNGDLRTCHACLGEVERVEGGRTENWAKMVSELPS